MRPRWRAGAGGLAIVLMASLSTSGLERPEPALTVRDRDGRTLAVVLLPPGGEFVLRYRNSLYGSLVEERFWVTADGWIQLRQLAADELAVLEEYYAIDRPARPAGGGEARAWIAAPPLDVQERQLLLAATALGERTLLVTGASPIPLWRLAQQGEPMLVLAVER